jgi:CDP-glucose 4,6-dehydratase
MNYKEIFRQTYLGKKVVLTGHTGFKGSWMLAWLKASGAVVRGYALAPESDDELYNLIGGDQLCESVIADILDKEKVIEEIVSFAPDFIFHFAAQPLVRLSYTRPLYTFEVNVNGTAHVLEALRQLPGRCNIILITTDKVYENMEKYYAYRETDKLGGYDPYSASKAAAEIVISSYRSSFFNPVDFPRHQKAIASARAGNVIGGGDFAADRIIPDIVRALRAGNSVTVRNPASVRPWQHVLEPLSGYLLLGARLAEDPVKFAEAWNFGPDSTDVLNVEELVKEAVSMFDNGSYEILECGDKQPHEAGLLQLSIEKAAACLDWKPRMSAVEAIRQTIRWYRSADKQNALALMLEQVEQYATGAMHS